MKKRLIFFLFLLIVIIILVLYFVCKKPIEKRPPILLKTASGIETTEFQLHDSVLFDAVALSPRTGYRVQIVREDGSIVTESRLSTDQNGRIPETVIWYDIGIKPCKDIPLHTSVVTYLSDREIFDMEYANRNYTLNIMENEKRIREMTFRVVGELIRPRLYAADSRACPKSGFLIGEEDIWAIGENFPPGSIIRLWAVPDRTEWKEGDELKDMTKQHKNELPPVFELKVNETSFKKKLWPKELTSIGSYDIVAEVVSYPFGSYHSTSTARVQNEVSKLSYSGFVIQRRQGAGEPLEMDLAGTHQSQLTYRDTFLTTENVYVGVDPAVQPSYMGKTADIYIVKSKTEAEWVNDPTLTDVTGYVEQITVQFVCSNCWATIAWTAPLTPGKYDVILDFYQDGKYTPGTDLIDSLDAVGFYVSDIRVDSISFRYSGSTAIALYDNVNHTNVNPPEYSSAGSVIKPAAWVMGGSHSVQVNFKAVSSVISAKIWAENGLGGLNSSGSPINVAFSGGNGQAIFNVNSPPALIGKHFFDWDWKCKDINGNPSTPMDMGMTGKHMLYTTYATPQAPMTNPWVAVIDRSCSWAQGKSDIIEARTAITAGLNAIGDQDGDVDYDPSNAYTSNGFAAWQFNLTGFLNDLATKTSVEINCADCANALQVFQNALGLNLQYRILDMGGYTNYIDPIGNGNPANSTDPVENWGKTWWLWHCVGWLSGDIVYDACLHLDGDGQPGSLTCSRLLPANLAFTVYRAALAPSSTSCNPDEQNVCTIF